MTSKQLSSIDLASDLVDRLVRLAAERSSALVVALDGPDCSGKTTLSKELLTLGKCRASIALAHFDDYLNQSSVRLQRGEFSPIGFRLDYFDFAAFVDGVLAPARQMKTPSAPNKPHIVLAEGLFLLDRRLKPYFDCVIRLEISDELILSRAIARDVGVLGDERWVRRHYQEQCIPAQQRYREEVSPERGALITALACEDNQYVVNF